MLLNKFLKFGIVKQQAEMAPKWQLKRKDALKCFIFLVKTVLIFNRAMHVALIGKGTKKKLFCCKLIRSTNSFLSLSTHIIAWGRVVLTLAAFFALEI